MHNFLWCWRICIVYSYSRSAPSSHGMARYSPLFFVITLFAVTVLICLVMSSSVMPAQVLEVDEQQHGAGKRVQRVLGCVPAPRSLLSPPSAAPLSARFAIGIQANAEYVHKWQKTLAAYAPEVRAQLAIFILGPPPRLSTPRLPSGGQRSRTPFCSPRRIRRAKTTLPFRTAALGTRMCPP